MDKRKVSIKNYIIYGIVVLISFACVFSLAKVYTDYQEEVKNSSLMTDTVVEIYSDNIDSFMLENDNIAIYLASSKEELNEFEKDFRAYIIEKQINEKIVFLNLELADESFLKDFIDDYYNSQSLTNITSPNIVLISENKIIDILYFSEKKITMEEVKAFLIKHEVVQ